MKAGLVSGLPKGGYCQLGADAIQLMTMKDIKGLEFPVVAVSGVELMPAQGRTRRWLHGCFMWLLRVCPKVGDGSRWGWRAWNEIGHQMNSSKKLKEILSLGGQSLSAASLQSKNY